MNQDVFDWNMDDGNKPDFLECLKDALEFFSEELENPTHNADTVYYSTQSPTTWGTPWTLERGHKAMVEIQKYRIRKSKHRKWTHGNNPRRIGDG